MKQNTRSFKVALSGILVSLMLILGWVESLIPLNIGVPGLKLGLSNSVLIFAVYMLDLPTAYCLMALKVLLSGLLFSGVSAMMFALAGGLLSLTGMCLLSRIPRMPLLAVSMAGGALHNIGQTALAMVILDTNKLVWYMVTLIPAGLLCGLLTGLSARVVTGRLKTFGTLPKTRPSGSHPARLAALLLILALAAYAFASNRALFAPPQEKPSVEWDMPDDDPAAFPSAPVISVK